MSEGYSNIPHDTYSTWRSYTIGRAFDLDSSYGCQCWDFASLFWRNVGFPAGYPRTGANHYASECWSANRTINAGSEFDLIYDFHDIKQGDVLVFDGDSGNPPGHITFADEDYNNTNRIACLGQNQGGTILPEGGTAVTVNSLNLTLFLGAFRYKGWESTPPTPPTPTAPAKKHFPWVLYARKRRGYV